MLYINWVNSCKEILASWYKKIHKNIVTDIFMWYECYCRGFCRSLKSFSSTRAHLFVYSSTFSMRTISYPKQRHSVNVHFYIHYEIYNSTKYMPRILQVDYILLHCWLRGFKFNSPFLRFRTTCHNNTKFACFCKYIPAFRTSV